MNLALPTGPLAQAVGWALLHLLWQGVAVAALTAVVLALLAHRSAATRYAVACGALVLIVALGVVTAFRSYPNTAVSKSVAPTAVAALERQAVPPSVASAPQSSRAWASVASRLLPKIVALWLAGVVLLSARLVLEWLRARRLVTHGAVRARDPWQSAARRLALALGVRRAITLLESAAVEVPSVVGLLRPAILLPVSTLTGLTPAQLEMILAHELAHIRRHDFLVNLLQAVVETLLFYHPAVWWLSRQIRIERENCCDDLAVAVCGNPVQYARALARLEELRARPASLAMAATGGSLLDRIRRLAGQSTQASGKAVRGAAALAVLSCVLLAIAAPTFPAIGQWEPPMKRDRDRVWNRYQTLVEREADRQSRGLGRDVTDGTAAARASLADLDAWNDVADAATASAGDEKSGSAGHDNGGRLTVDQLIMLRSQNVTAADIKSWRSTFPDASLEDIAGLSASGATLQFVGEMRAAGLQVKTADDAQGLAASGVTVAGVKALREAGISITTAEEAQGLAATGVTPQFVRDIRAAGVPVKTAEEAQGLAATGVTVELIKSLRAAGITIESAEDAQGLAAVGVTPEVVRELRATGLTFKSTDQVQGLVAVGVTAEYVKSMKAAGVAIATADEAQSLKAQDVDPQFVKKLADAGYKNLTVDELSRLAGAGVNGDFIREMSQYRNR